MSQGGMKTVCSQHCCFNASSSAVPISLRGFCSTLTHLEDKNQCREDCAFISPRHYRGLQFSGRVAQQRYTHQLSSFDTNYSKLHLISYLAVISIARIFPYFS